MPAFHNTRPDGLVRRYSASVPSRGRRLRAGIAALLGLPIAVWVLPVGTAAADDGGTLHGWHVRPASGPVGTVVRYNGTLPPGEVTGSRNIFVGLSSFTRLPDGTQCDLVVFIEREHHRYDSETRHIHGTFTVGRTGGCRQAISAAAAGTHALVPGTYALAVAAPAYVVGEFQVTPSTLAFSGIGGLGVQAVLAAALIAAGVLALVLSRRHLPGG